jgi:predicted O-linked N-acetylglucosamine transferase (SPINDLY family)
MQLCDWRNFNQECGDLIRATLAGQKCAPPFALIPIASSLEAQLASSRTFARDRYPARPPLWRGEAYAHDRLRVGYFSSDFHAHATAALVAGLLESHDRSRFEVTAFSYGPPSDDPWRRRLEAGVERFLDVSSRTDDEIASLARKMEIDIAVDLKGFTTGARTGIFALRPAPVQAAYLGYAGTLGTDYIDYILADPVVIADGHERHYSEKAVLLPGCYQANDSKRPIASRDFSRAELGLPANGFVFCCFNGGYKITPDVFDAWMRLLAAVPGSVLWLLAGPATAQDNLRSAARDRGVDPGRLVFAPVMEPDLHLARHRAADLFLDTFHCNAHTTASDALWAGLPVVTLLGETFASRVGASLLRAVGLPDLVATSVAQYERLALKLATEPGSLEEVRARLTANRETHPLFDTVAFTRDLERAYQMMHERHARGLPAARIAVPPRTP